jgi:hypothetical protein
MQLSQAEICRSMQHALFSTSEYKDFLLHQSMIVFDNIELSDIDKLTD